MGILKSGIMRSCKGMLYCLSFEGVGEAGLMLLLDLDITCSCLLKIDDQINPLNAIDVNFPDKTWGIYRTKKLIIIDKEVRLIMWKSIIRFAVAVKMQISHITEVLSKHYKGKIFILVGRSHVKYDSRRSTICLFPEFGMELLWEVEQDFKPLLSSFSLVTTKIRW